jgi:hypothetical protein
MERLDVAFSSEYASLSARMVSTVPSLLALLAMRPEASCRVPPPASLTPGPGPPPLTLMKTTAHCTSPSLDRLSSIHDRQFLFNYGLFPDKRPKTVLSTSLN